MKTIFFCLFFFTSNILYGQKSTVVPFISENAYQQLTSEDFMNHDFDKIEAYSITIKENGKISKDSILLFNQQFDSINNRIYGIQCNTYYQTSGPKYLNWDNFEMHFNKKGQLIKAVDEPLSIEKKDEYGSLSYSIIKNETLFDYDTNGLCVKKIVNRFDNRFSIIGSTKDTFHLLYLQPKINEYYYNEKGQEISNYFTNDSTRFISTKSNKANAASIICSYCDPRYLNTSKEYFENGKLKIFTSFTREGEVHSKIYYFYDEKGMLVKQVDSTGWYLQKYSDKQPSLKSISFYNYRDTTLIEKITIRDNWKYTNQFDNFGNFSKSCLTIDSVTTCTEYFYQFENDKLMSIISINNGIDKTETSFTYNTKGLLAQKKVMYNNKTTQLIRYYYH